MKPPVSVFDYFDYRVYLDEYYIARKAVDSKFSYRYFAMKAGYNSSGLYSSIVQGKVNLTENTIPKFVKALNLAETEVLYFELMIQFTHAQTAKAKQNVFEEMLPFLPPKSRHLAEDHKEYYSRWYITAVHQILDVYDFSEDFEDLALFLIPNISVDQAKSAIAVLQSLGLINKNEDSYWKSKDQSILGGADVGKAFIHEFQREMIDLGKESLNRFSKERRNISTITLSLSREGRDRILEKANSFQKDLVEIARSDSNENQIFQLNLQFFPLSRRKAPDV